LLFAALLLTFLPSVAAQSAPPPPAQTPHWKNYSYPAAGFSATFSAEPKMDVKKQSAALGTILFTSYCAQLSDSSLCAAVIDQGPQSTGLEPEALMERLMMGIELVPQARTLNEKKIELQGHSGVEVETVNGTAHIIARIYFVENTLYEVMVTAPVEGKFPDAPKFLDSFRLIRRFAN
jgi:hypothetical protein